ncbi:hypothetical protein, partial [Ehrlichia ruminantium]|uniref:hypothetical protein n=1 Tax=Ehrlichia ruminantium TaxID=779 RepID=UPI000A4F98C0
VTEEHSDSAASSESIDKESSEDGQLDQTSMEEQDKVGESEVAEDASIDGKEVSGKPDIVEPVQEGSETKPEAVEVESNESEGVVSVTEEHSDS